MATAINVFNKPGEPKYITQKYNLEKIWLPLPSIAS